MSPEPLRLLLIEDSPSDAEIVLRELRRGGYAPVHERVESAEGLLAALERGPWDLVVSDYRMPRFTGLEALALLNERGIDLPFILVSGAMGEDVAVQAMKAGAHDYVMKDRPARLLPAVRRELAEAQVRRRRREAEEEVKRAYEDLERRVRERTHELSQANSRLKEELAERHRLEEERQRMFVQLLRGQKLQAIGQLAAGVAHEINNPVGWILSNLSTLEDYAATLERLLDGTAALAADSAACARLRKEAEADFLFKDFAEAVRDCREGAVRIRDIVANLKSFSRADAPEPEEADLAEICESAIRLCTGELKYKAAVVREFGALPKVPCRPREIEQVLINLLVNAAQAIPERGEIRIRTEREGDAAVLRVRDTGVGISAEHQKRLFEPFFTTKPVGKGTGLGLHVAFKIVRSHGGRIGVASTPGAGTEVSVRLPLARTPVKRAGETPLAVVVDDDPASLRALRRALAAESVRCLATRDPRKALDWVTRRKVRLLLTDQRMPEMQGTALLEEVARRSPATRRILVTAWPEAREVEGARGKAAEAVLPKPWDAAEFSRVLRSVLMEASA